MQMAAPQTDWHRRALALAWVTIAWNVLEGLASMGLGAAGESLALFGFGVDSWIEVASASVVLWRLRGPRGCATTARRRERRASLVIGVLFTVLGLGAAAGAVLQLVTGGHPESSLPGLVVSTLSLSFMAFLWRAKLAAARALDSRTLELDAACARGCLQLSAVLLVGSALFGLSPALWWADGAAALVLGALIAKEGIEGVRAARAPDFAGGCGCG